MHKKVKLRRQHVPLEIPLNPRQLIWVQPPRNMRRIFTSPYCLRTTALSSPHLRFLHTVGKGGDLTNRLVQDKFTIGLSNKSELEYYDSHYAIYQTILVTKINF